MIKKLGIRMVSMFICTVLCLVTVFAVDARTVGNETRVSINGITYTFRAHINRASDGSVYGGVSINSSKPLPEGYMSVRAMLETEYIGSISNQTDWIENANNNSTATCTTTRATQVDTYRCIGIVRIYNSRTGEYEYYDDVASPYLTVH